jgi:hypothetical protein
MNLKDYIQESLNKEYSYVVKIAKNCGNDEMTALESALVKYDFRSASDWKRMPIQENPMEFARLKGARFTSEVCSSTVSLGYPVNERILEVFLAVQMGVPHERVIVYPVKDPRASTSVEAEEKLAANQDRYADMEDAKLVTDIAEDEDLDDDLLLYGEEYNEAFLAELARIKAEKGADYFRVYPSKDELMGQKHAALMNDLMNTPNMGKGAEAGKEVDVISQSARRN